MKNQIAYCGIDCAGCPAYIAKKTNDENLRKKTAAEWSKMFNAQMKPEDINCDGCTATGQHILYCDSMCEIRKCAIQKNVTNCAYCEKYACETLTAFLKQVPEAKERLDKIAENR